LLFDYPNFLDHSLIRDYCKSLYGSYPKLVQDYYKVFSYRINPTVTTQKIFCFPGLIALFIGDAYVTETVKTGNSSYASHTVLFSNVKKFDGTDNRILLDYNYHTFSDRGQTITRKFFIHFNQLIFNSAVSPSNAVGLAQNFSCVLSGKLLTFTDKIFYKNLSSDFAPY